MRGETGPDFIEALARGLDVIRAFGPNRPVMTLSEVAAATGLARPTARRMLLTLEELGYVRMAQGGFALTARVLELGMAYVGSSSIWDIARPHMEQLVGQIGESSSLAQLDGSDIVYVARVAVPKIITFAVTIGTRFPALQTSLGKVLLAELPPDKLERVLAEPSRSGYRMRMNANGCCARCGREDGRLRMSIWRVVFARLQRQCAMVASKWWLR
jgi:IclR family pca regulon transcriptional regulator